MAIASGPNPYLKTKVLTASPAELRLMLFDGAIKYLQQAKEGLLEKQHEKAFEGFTRCQSIVMELMNALEPKHAPELCKQLSALYTFIYTRSVTACVERDPEVTEEVLELLRYERETWAMLMEQLAGAQGDDGSDTVEG